MSPTRLRKRIARALMVSWREQPTRYDIEALQANTRRVGLVVRVRWALVTALTIYSVLGVGAYARIMPARELVSNMLVPALALVFVCFYNTYYHFTYRRLGNIAILNHLQLLLDTAVVTLLVYYSGGVNSWFWSMYALFIFEAAFILPKRRNTWLMALWCAAALAIIEWGEFLGVISHITVPFASPDLYANLTYVAVRFLWQLTVLAGSAAVATLMVGALASREEQLAASAIVDDKTGLYNRAYFHRALHAELDRARRDEHPIHVLIADINHFGEVNRRLGIDAGDRLLKGVADAILLTLADVGDAMLSTNVASRYGGEEFAVLISEDRTHGRLPSHADAIALAERMRSAIAAVRVGEAGVTVSIGVASYPEDGSTLDDLLTAADEALGRAGEAGGDRVAGTSSV